VNDRRLWKLLADVNVMDGNAEAAQEALRHLPDADPDPAWRCTSCGTQHGRWHAVCDTCRSTGTIQWMQPGETAPTQLRRLQQPQGVEGLTA
jgi:HemY protein